MPISGNLYSAIELLSSAKADKKILDNITYTLIGSRKQNATTKLVHLPLININKQLICLICRTDDALATGTVTIIPNGGKPIEELGLERGAKKK